MEKYDQEELSNGSPSQIADTDAVEAKQETPTVHFTFTLNDGLQEDTD